MNSYVRPLLAGLLLAGVSGAAGAQTTPATRACLPGEQLIGGVCRPLTGTPDRPSVNAPQPGQPNTTGSTGTGISGNQNTGANPQPNTTGATGTGVSGNQNTGANPGQGGGSGTGSIGN